MTLRNFSKFVPLIILSPFRQALCRTISSLACRNCLCIFINCIIITLIQSLVIYFHSFLYFVNESHGFFTIFDIFANRYSIIDTNIIHYFIAYISFTPQTASASSLSSHQSLRYTALHP